MNRMQSQPVERSGGRWPIVVVVLALLGAGLWWLRGAERDTPAVAATAADDSTTRSTAAMGTGPRDRPELVIDPRRGERASVSGSVRDPQGRPVAGAQVCAQAQSSRLASADVRTASCTTTGPDGHYRIGDLFGVRHRVTASAPTYIPAVYFHGEGVARRESVDLRPAVAVDGIDIVLEGGGVEIKGIVKDLSGGAVEGAQVVAGELGISFSGADGAFATWVRPGDVNVRPAPRATPRATTTARAPGHVFEVFLTPEAVLVGKVVRIGDGSPVEGARVTAETGGWGWNQATAFTDGERQLPPRRPPARPVQGARRGGRRRSGWPTSRRSSDSARPRSRSSSRRTRRSSSRVHVVVEGGDVCPDGWVSVLDKANDRNAYDGGRAGRDAARPRPVAGRLRGGRHAAASSRRSGIPRATSPTAA